MTGNLFDSAPAPIAHFWRAAVEAFRAQGVLGRDVEVAKLAMVCARFQATGRPPRLLILGGPGTGKKLLTEATAAALKLPILSHHASTLSGTGWQGKSVQDILDHPSARYGGSTLVIHGLEAVTVTRGAHGNTVDRVTQICTDLAVAATGPGSVTAFIATANLPRLRPLQGGGGLPLAMPSGGAIFEEMGVAGLGLPTLLLYWPDPVPLDDQEKALECVANQRVDVSGRGGRAVECTGLENRRPFTGLVSSNLTRAVR